MRNAVVASLLSLAQSSSPAPGRMVDAGGHLLHVNCVGRGQPTVVVETGLGDSSTDWTVVQQRAAGFARVCTYDRAGYGWSAPGPMPRTFDQLVYELRKALRTAGERGPFVLVGHSYGGGVVRQHALSFPSDVAGLVFVDIVGEHQYVSMGPHAGRIGDGAQGRAIPAPRDGAGETLASAGANLEAAENSQREWSTEYFAKWASASQKGTLGHLPLIVLTRAKGGYGTNLDRPADELERARLDAQRALAELSTAGTQRLIDAGHNMHTEVPDAVVRAIRDVIAMSRRKGVI